MTGTAIFLDTSIQIARFFYARQTKAKIEKRISEYNIRATSLVVRQEFKRRILGEAKYLLSWLRRLKSFNEMRRWINLLPMHWSRKRNICLDLLDTIGELEEGKESDKDKTDRAQRMLEGLIEFGLMDFDNTVDHVFTDSGCACAIEPVRIDNEGRVNLGKAKCSQVASQCGIAAFLGQNSELLNAICRAIDSTSPADMTEELKRTRAFLGRILSDSSDVEKEDPCTKVGDLLIAIESRTVKTFYTLNEKESKILCPCLGQILVVRPKNYMHEDKILPA
jgi:hypothetical protein